MLEEWVSVIKELPQQKSLHADADEIPRNSYKKAQHSEKAYWCSLPLLYNYSRAYDLHLRYVNIYRTYWRICVPPTGTLLIPEVFTPRSRLLSSPGIGGLQTYVHHSFVNKQKKCYTQKMFDQCWRFGSAGSHPGTPDPKTDPRRGSTFLT